MSVNNTPLFLGRRNLTTALNVDQNVDLVAQRELIQSQIRLSVTRWQLIFVKDWVEVSKTLFLWFFVGFRVRNLSHYLVGLSKRKCCNFWRYLAWGDGECDDSCPTPPLGHCCVNGECKQKTSEKDCDVLHVSSFQKLIHFFECSLTITSGWILWCCWLCLCT